MNTHQALAVDHRGTAILGVCFNQDESCFSVAHERGFHVYSSDPVDVRVKRDFSKHTNNNHNNNHNNNNNNISNVSNNSNHNNGNGSGIAVVGMLHRTNYLALVGGGRRPKFPNTRVVIWDDLKRKALLLLDFMLPVLNVGLSRVKIVVALENQLLVYSFLSPPRKLAAYDLHNPFGLVAIAAYQDGLIITFPARQLGQIQIVDIPLVAKARNTVQIVRAHRGAVRCLALSHSGQYVALALETGTIIRVHLTRSTALAFEFRRGLDKATITSMAFLPNDARLAVLSDRGTLHIYHMGDDQNKHHVLGRLPVVPAYFKLTWLFCLASAGGDSGEKNDRGVLAWLGNESVLIVWKERRIWEKWMVVERVDDVVTWELVRDSWKRLLDDE